MRPVVLTSLLALTACSFSLSSDGNSSFSVGLPEPEPDVDTTVLERTYIQLTASEPLALTTTGSLDCGLSVPLGHSWILQGVTRLGETRFVIGSDDNAVLLVALSPAEGLLWARTYTAESPLTEVLVGRHNGRLQIESWSYDDDRAQGRIAHVLADGSPAPVEDPNVSDDLDTSGSGVALGQLGDVGGGFDGLVAMGPNEEIMWMRPTPSLGDATAVTRWDDGHALAVYGLRESGATTLYLVRTDADFAPACADAASMTPPWSDQDGQLMMVLEAEWAKARATLAK